MYIYIYMNTLKDEINDDKMVYDDNDNCYIGPYGKNVWDGYFWRSNEKFNV